MKWGILPQAFPASLAGCYGLGSLINPDKPFHAASWWSIPPVTCHFSSSETNEASFCRQRCARKQKLLNSHSRQCCKILLPLSFPTTISGTIATAEAAWTGLDLKLHVSQFTCLLTPFYLFWVLVEIMFLKSLWEISSLFMQKAETDLIRCDGWAQMDPGIRNMRESWRWPWAETGGEPSVL